MAPNPALRPARERERWLSLAGFAAVVLLQSLWLQRAAAAAPLKYDECYTIHLSRFQNLAQLREWLAAGVDLNPPLNYILVRAAGADLRAARLVSAAAFLATGILAFLWFRARHRSELAGWLAGLAVYGSNLAHHAVIGRAYAPLLLETVAALWGWRLASPLNRAPKRALGVALAVAALAAAIHTHYFGVFLALPLLAGELARALDRQRPGPLLAVAVLAALAASALHLQPLLDVARQHAEGFWSRPSLAEIERLHGAILVNAALPLLLTAAVLYAFRNAKPTDTEPDTDPTDTPSDVVVLATLAIPAAGLAAALALDAGFAPRYVLAGHLGAIGLYAGLATPALQRRTLPAVLVLATLAVWCALGNELRSREHESDAAASRKILDAAIAAVRRAEAENRRALLADSHLFLTLALRKPELAPSLLCPLDPKQALRRVGHDTDDRNIRALATRVAPRLNIADFEQLQPRPGDRVLGDGWPADAWREIGVVLQDETPAENPLRVRKVVAVPDRTPDADPHPDHRPRTR